LGTPKANMVVAGLVTANTGTAAITVATVHATSSNRLLPLDVITASPPSSPTAGNGTSSSSSSGSTTTTSITPLGPNTVVIIVVIGRTPVVVVVQPAPLVARIGPSTSSASSPLSNVPLLGQDQSTTHLGQSVDSENGEAGRRKWLGAVPEGTPSIDV